MIAVALPADVLALADAVLPSLEGFTVDFVRGLVSVP